MSPGSGRIPYEVERLAEVIKRGLNLGATPITCRGFAVDGIAPNRCIGRMGCL